MNGMILTPKPGPSKAKKTTTWLACATLVVGAAEGCLTYAYKDPLGIPTICYGETKGVQMGDKATQEECDTKLAKSLIEFDADMQRRIGKEKVEALPPQTRAMFVSLYYNVGPGGKGVKDGFFTLKSGNPSTISTKIRAGDLYGACMEFPKWDNPKWLRGIAIRRDKEMGICLEGLSPSKVSYSDALRVPGAFSWLT